MTLTELVRHLKPVPRLRAPLILMTDDVRLPDPRRVLTMVPPPGRTGGTLLIVRHTQSPQRAALALDLGRVCRARRIGFSVAGDLGLAVRFRSGLHLSESQARTAGPRIRLWHRSAKRVLTVAAHNRLALRRGRCLGADAALLSPLFPTKSHPEATGLGLLAFRRLARSAGLPVYALGGVTAGTFRRARLSGAVGVATVGGVSPDRGTADSAKDIGPHSR